MSSFENSTLFTTNSKLLKPLKSWPLFLFNWLFANSMFMLLFLSCYKSLIWCVYFGTYEMSNVTVLSLFYRVIGNQWPPFHTEIQYERAAIHFQSPCITDQVTKNEQIYGLVHCFFYPTLTMIQNRFSCWFFFYLFKNQIKLFL